MLWGRNQFGGMAADEPTSCEDDYAITISRVQEEDERGACATLESDRSHSGLDSEGNPSLTMPSNATHLPSIPVPHVKPIQSIENRLNI